MNPTYDPIYQMTGFGDLKIEHRGTVPGGQTLVMPIDYRIVRRVSRLGGEWDKKNGGVE